MQRGTAGVLFACAIAAAFAACGDDASHRAQQENEAGDAGQGPAAAGRGTPGDGGAADITTGGSSGAAAQTSAGEGGASHAGSPGAAGELNTSGAGACDSFDDLLAPRALCDSLRTCYPELQGVQRSCVAPGDGDTVDSYAFFDFAYYPNLPAIRACLCALPDPGPARAWVDCTLAAEPTAATCFDACPALGNGCAEPYQTSAQACDDQNHLGFIAVANCLVAE